jgi:hypothetical protein
MNHEQRVREMERAAVERWFAQTPIGLVFDAGDGRTLQIRADMVESAREEAFAIIDKFIIASRPPPQWAMVAVIIAFSLALLALQPRLGLGGGQIGGIVAAGLLLWHGDDWLRLLRYRRDLRALRARTAAALALRTPVPEELAARYRRGNPWRTALHIWVFGLAALSLLAMHFLPPESVDAGIMTLAIAAVGVAWALYFLARRTDLAQQASRQAGFPASAALPPGQSAGSSVNGQLRL